MNNVFAYDRNGQWARSVASIRPVDCDELRVALNSRFETPGPIPQRLAGLFYMGLVSWALIAAAGAAILR